MFRCQKAMLAFILQCIGACVVSAAVCIFFATGWIIWLGTSTSPTRNTSLGRRLLFWFIYGMVVVIDSDGSTAYVPGAMLLKVRKSVPVLQALASAIGGGGGGGGGAIPPIRSAVPPIRSAVPPIRGETAPLKRSGRLQPAT